ERRQLRQELAAWPEPPDLGTVGLVRAIEDYRAAHRTAGRPDPVRVALDFGSDDTAFAAFAGLGRELGAPASILRGRQVVLHDRGVSEPGTITADEVYHCVGEQAWAG